jgi:hypothetical protein
MARTWLDRFISRPAPIRAAMAAAFVITAGCGYAFYGKPSPPTQPFTHLQQLGAFLVFIAWTIGLIAWGDVLAALLRVRHNTPTAPVVIVALGAAWAALVACVLGLLGAVGPHYASLWQSMLALGVLLAALRPTGAQPEPGPVPQQAADCGDTAANPPAVLTWILLAANLLVFVLVLAQASRLDMFFPDPLWYHLAAPRFWFEHGRIAFDPANIAHYHSGLWDVLYLWPHQLLAHAGGGGMVAVHFFGQWTHAVIGFGGCMLAIYALARQFGIGRAWALLAVLAVVTARPLLFTAAMAKNDWGAMLWVLTAFLLLMRSPVIDTRRMLAVGLLTGAAFTAKFTTGFVLLPMTLVAVWLCWRHSAMRPFAIFACAAVLAAAPILLRNAMHTGNPLFPTMNTLFASPHIGPTWQFAMAQDFEGGLANLRRPGLLVLRLMDFTTSGPTMWLLLAAPFAWRCAPVPAPLRAALLVLGAGFILFCLGAGAALENRLFAPGIAIGFIVAVAFTARFVQSSDDRRSLQPTMIGAMIFASLLMSGIPWRALPSLIAAPSPGIQTQDLVGWPSFAWIRNNLNADHGVLFATETRTYYLTDYRATRISDHATLDRATVAADDVLDAVEAMLRFNYTHMLIATSEVADPSYVNQELYERLRRASLMHRAQVVRHEGWRDGRVESIVVDLASLRSALRENLPPAADAPAHADMR